jgi:alginate O-acetyltransferase complex protein AlgI
MRGFIGWCLLGALMFLAYLQNVNTIGAEVVTFNSKGLVQAEHLGQTRGSTYRVMPNRIGESGTFLLELTVEGDHELRYAEKYQRNNYLCWKLTENQSKCLYYIDYVSSDRYLFIDITSSQGAINKLELTGLKVKRDTTINELPSWAAALCLLMLSGVVLLSSLSMKSRNVDQLKDLTLLTISITLLTSISLLYSGLLLGSLYVIFCYCKKGKGSRALVPLFLCGSTAALLVAKYYLPVFADYFGYSEVVNYAIPIGFSYIVIKVIDYGLASYKGHLPEHSFFQLLLYMLMPTTLFAGPIFSFNQFYNSKNQKHGKTYRVLAIRRVFWGFFKKIVIADFILRDKLGMNFQEVFITFDEVGHSDQAFYYLFIALLLVYIDFSAYTDIAKGATRLIGYDVPENFNFPFLAKTPKEYWNRWHMSLSNWCMRNIYFPVMIATKQPFFSIFAVMSAIGLWHSLSLGWLLWALHHSVGIYFLSALLEQGLKKAPDSRILKFGLTLITISYIALGHSFASVSDLSTSINLYLNFLLYVPLQLIGVLT